LRDGRLLARANNGRSEYRSKPVLSSYRKDIVVEVAQRLIGGALRPLISQGGGGISGHFIA
jgi:hypothetical protein